jgi:hypothetical protein
MRNDKSSSYKNKKCKSIDHVDVGKSFKNGENKFNHAPSISAQTCGHVTKNIQVQAFNQYGV